MPDYTPLSYVGPDVDPKTRIALAMMQQGMDSTPIRSWTQGADRVAKALLGGYMLNKQQQSQKDAMSGIVGSLLGPNGDTTATPSAAPATPSIPPAALSGSPMADTAAPMSGGTPGGSPYGGAISSIESGGDYKSLGPVTKTGDRAFGKYQVMGANIPQWTQETLGQSMTPEQFLASPQAQDAVFNSKFGQYAQKYGPEGAAKAWFSGEGGMNNPNATDQLGTTVAGYAKKFMDALGPSQANASPAIQSGPQAPNVMQPSPMSAQPMAFAGQPQQGNPLASAVPQAPPAMQPILTGGMQPSPAGSQTNITNVPVQQAQLPIGNNQQQGKPILAPPQRANPTVPDNVRQAIITAINSPDPNARAMGMAMLQKYTQPQQYGFQTLGDGTIIRTNPATGGVEPVYQSNKPQFQKLKGPLGDDIPVWVDPTTQKMTPAQGTTGGPTGGGIGVYAHGVSQADSTKTGDEYLNQFSPEVKSIVHAYINGDQMPTGNPRLQGMLPFAKTVATKYAMDQGIPFSDTAYAAKRQLQTQLSSGAPASIGGRLNALRNSFDHLANASESALQKGNIDLGFWPLSFGANQLKSTTTSQQDIRNKLEREAVTYGGERTKFLTGGEGSEQERMAFLRSLGPDSAAPPQMAGAFEGEYNQIKSALLNQEQQIRTQLGDDYLKRNPVVTPEVKASMTRIEKNISALRGGGTPTQTQTAPQTNTKTINGKTYVNQNGQWFEQ